MNTPSHTQGTRATDSPPPAPPPAPPPDNMPYTNYFDNPYLSDVYNAGPDYSLNAFFDSDTFFEQPVTSVEGSSKSQGGLPPRLPSTGMPPTMNPQQSFAPNFEHPAFNQFEQYQGNFSMHPTPPQGGDPDCFSPATTTMTMPEASHSSSHSGGTPQQAVSPSMSPHMLKRESPSSPASASESSTPKRPTRKRGRPKLDRRNTDDSQAAAAISSPTLKSQQRSRRQPHNQVERKYREGLNSELERLRRAVPSLRQSDEVGAIGQPRPSKAMILASAIEYIQTVEQERDALKQEVEALRRNQVTMRGGSDRRHELMDEFLMDP